VSRKVWVFVEGGGDSRQEQTPLRVGFGQLIKQWLGELPQPTVIACGGRARAFRDFSIAVRKYPGDLCLLLVDSEAPVGDGVAAWEHVLRRVGDGWVRPDGVGEDRLFFMAQAMEAWLIADAEALAKFYGQKFRAQDIPARANVEDVAKQDLFEALRKATRDTRAYSKRDGFALIGRISAARVCERSPVHARRFFQRLSEAMAR